MSLLQNGPLPCFLSEEAFSQVLLEATPFHRQFAKGLNELGLIDVSFVDFFSSPELKAQVSYSDLPLSVCL